jgi:hypothetical protein
VFILITIPLVPRVKFCPLQYCPTCHSKAAWNQGLPLLGVHVFFYFLPSTIDAPAVHQHVSIHLGIRDFFNIYFSRFIICC